MLDSSRVFLSPQIKVHRPFGAAALLSLHIFTGSLSARHRVPLTMCDPWIHEAQNRDSKPTKLASVMYINERERTHQRSQELSPISSKRIVLHLAIQTSVDGARMVRTGKNTVPPGNVLTRDCPVGLSLDSSRDLSLDVDLLLTTPFYSRVLLATPYANTFISFKQQSFFIINRCSFFHFARFVMIFLIPENAL